MDSLKLSISVAMNFSKTPGPRFVRQGPHSGQKFRSSVLAPALNTLPNGGALIVDLDGTAGYGSSFIDEAFGGLIRSEGFSRQSLLDSIQIKSDEEIELIEDVRQAFMDAKPASDSRT